MAAAVIALLWDLRAKDPAASPVEGRVEEGIRCTAAS
jgi:hypothetical protein